VLAFVGCAEADMSEGAVTVVRCLLKEAKVLRKTWALVSRYRRVDRAVHLEPSM
jgi:hypothetical protein